MARDFWTEVFDLKRRVDILDKRFTRYEDALLKIATNDESEYAGYYRKDLAREALEDTYDFDTGVPVRKPK